MSIYEHTSGTWEWGGFAAGGGYTTVWLYAGTETFEFRAKHDNVPVGRVEANVTRIVACLNACRHLTTEQLQGATFEPADDESPLFELVRGE
jgi:hypothetical protein